MLDKEQVKLLEQIKLLLETQLIVDTSSSSLIEWVDEQVEYLIEELTGKEDDGSND